MPEGSYLSNVSCACLSLARPDVRTQLFCALLAIFATFTSFADNLVVFDGGSVSEGEGFAHPRGISKFELSRQNPFRNAEHLQYELKITDGWAGGGWSWHAWEGEGDDISGYSEISFHISLSPSRLKDLTFQLTSRNPGSHDGMGRKVSILALIMKRGEYVEIRIPVSKLLGGSLDQKAVWGFNIAVLPQPGSSADDCNIRFDMIEFRR